MFIDPAWRGREGGAERRLRNVGNCSPGQASFNAGHGKPGAAWLCRGTDRPCALHPGSALPERLGEFSATRDPRHARAAVFKAGGPAPRRICGAPGRGSAGTGPGLRSPDRRPCAAGRVPILERVRPRRRPGGLRLSATGPWSRFWAARGPRPGAQSCPDRMPRSPAAGPFPAAPSTAGRRTPYRNPRRPPCPAGRHPAPRRLPAARPCPAERQRRVRSSPAWCRPHFRQLFLRRYRRPEPARPKMRRAEMPSQ